jgi:hypothetical protein
MDRLEKLLEMDYESRMSLLYQWVKTGVISKSEFMRYIEVIFDNGY